MPEFLKTHVAWSTRGALTLALLLTGLLLSTSCRSDETNDETETAAPQEIPPPTTYADPVVQQDPEEDAAPAPTTAPEESRSQLLRDPGNTGSTAERLARLRSSISLEIDYLISQGEVRQLSGYVGGLRRVALEGQPPDREHNAFRLAADNSYGFGLQVWKFRTPDLASSHFNRMRETYVVSGSTRVDGQTAFWASIGGIRQLVFLGGRRSYVAAVSCDETVCTERDVLLEIAERVASRL